MPTALRTTLAAVLLIAVAGCSSTGTGSKSAATTAATYPADEQAALNALHPACVDSDAKLDLYASNALGLLVKAGITDETKLSVLQHLRQSMPASSAGMKCDEQLGAYVTLREQPK